MSFCLSVCLSALDCARDQNKDNFGIGLCVDSRLQASGMGLFYIRVNVKALDTGNITKWSPNTTLWHDQDQDLFIHGWAYFTYLAVSVA
jgi:hypothetical protein